MLRRTAARPSSVCEDLSAAIRYASSDLRDILSDVEKLRDTLNDYEPTLQESLKTVSSLSNSAVKTIRDTQSLVTDTENLMKSTGSTLDDGTKQTLEGPRRWSGSPPRSPFRHLPHPAR